MLSAPICHDHQSVLSSWRSSADYSRANLLRLLEQSLPFLLDGCSSGSYRVRMVGEAKWRECDSPPVSGAAEWLFLNRKNVPLLYWNSEKNSVMLI